MSADVEGAAGPAGQDEGKATQIPGEFRNGYAVRGVGGVKPGSGIQFTAELAWRPTYMTGGGAVVGGGLEVTAFRTTSGVAPVLSAEFAPAFSIPSGPLVELAGGLQMWPGRSLVAPILSARVISPLGHIEIGGRVILAGDDPLYMFGIGLRF